MRYPVGEFAMPTSITPAARAEAIETIAALPLKMRAAVSGLSESQLDTRYRPGGWTVRQVVHHVPDSHVNAYIRLKLAITESNPTIKPYDQDSWAQLPDQRMPIEVSLSMLDAVHARWTTVLRALAAGEFSRPMFHPEIGSITVDYLVQLYSWHSRHHVAHITRLRDREGW
jgi:hypothetical protein